jgi:L-ascorbate metabolism protein UlaG (beta-lactamase superfamily)
VSPPIEITWLGHASVLVDIDGFRLVTDPVLAPRLGHLVRRSGAAPDVEPVDAVLISHLHMDHLHRPSLRRVAAGARAVVPDGGAPLVRGVGADDVDGVAPGDRLVLHRGRAGSAGTSVDVEVEVEVVHAEHGHGRGPHSRHRARPVGFVIRAAGAAVYFAGDTALFPQMAELGPVDVALLPIWGWGPTLGHGHLDPAGAAEATGVIGPRAVVPIHWGTYSPIRLGRGGPVWLDTPLTRFRHQLDRGGLGHALTPLAPGGSFRLRPR